MNSRAWTDLVLAYDWPRSEVRAVIVSPFQVYSQDGSRGLRRPRNLPRWVDFSSCLVLFVSALFAVSENLETWITYAYHSLIFIFALSFSVH